MRRIDVTEEAEKMLIAYDWPGNIRELTNALEFAYNMMTDYVIDYGHLPLRIQNHYLRNNTESSVGFEKLSDILRRTEVQVIQNALGVFGHDMDGKKKAADALGISLATLYNKISK